MFIGGLAVAIFEVWATEDSDCPQPLSLSIVTPKTTDSNRRSKMKFFYWGLREQSVVADRAIAWLRGRDGSDFLTRSQKKARTLVD